MTRLRVRILCTVAVGAYVALMLLPTSRDLLQLSVPLDTALRVPRLAALLPSTGGLDAVDRVVGMELAAGGVLLPASRSELLGLLGTGPGSVTLRVARGGEVIPVPAHFRNVTRWEALAPAWHLLIVAGAYLLFALLVLWGSAHPVALPIFALSACAGGALLSLVDLLLAEPSTGSVWLELRQRAAIVVQLLVPASLLHLSMCFPVMRSRVRSPAFAALPYGLSLMLCVAALTRFGDPALLGAVEAVGLGSLFIFGAVLMTSSAFYLGRMNQIERSRAIALVAGLAIGLGSVSLLVTEAGGASMRALLALSLVGVPLLLGWAIVRYRLLDPPPWMRQLLLSSATILVALVLCFGLLELGIRASGVEATWDTREALLLALATTLVYQLLRSGIDRSAKFFLGEGNDFAEFAEAAADRLSSASTEPGVLETACQLAADFVGAAAAVTVRADDEAAASALARHGIALARTQAADSDGLVASGSRVEDPQEDSAEVVVSLPAVSGPAFLLVLGPRLDRLPYDDEHLRILARLRDLVGLALGSVASRTRLEEMVRQRTGALRRSLDDQQRVLDAARSICEADAPEEVAKRIQTFLGAGRERAGASGSELDTRLWWPDGAERRVGARVPEDRVEELRAPLETLSVFGSLAIRRLALLGDLKREVERQSVEIAQLETRRMYAEFVREVAHELRKPTEEILQIASAIGSAGEPGAEVQQLLSTTTEMSRRLDLLLFHSDLRLDRRVVDLVPLIEEVVSRFERVHPDRRYCVAHQRPKLPILADPVRLASMLENLLDNAVKATSPAGRIALRSGAAGPTLHFSVEDDGVGIRGDRIERIFEPGVCFGPGGFGLGLSLCREIATRHGGRVEVQSDAGRTVFRVELPQFDSADGVPAGEVT